MTPSTAPLLRLAALLPLALSACGDSGTGVPDGGGAPGLVQQGHLVHRGSFHVPGGIHVGSAMAGFEYGGTSIGFNPERGSLYLVGHDWDQLTAPRRSRTSSGRSTWA